MGHERLLEQPLHLEGGMAPPDCGSLRADGPLGLASKLQDMLTREQASHRETQHELQIERAAHDDTAERLVEMQQKLEATLQELSNLERFVKGCSACSSVPSNTPPEREPLLKEEAYLQSRLRFVQEELTSSASTAVTRPSSASIGRKGKAAASPGDDALRT